GAPRGPGQRPTGGGGRPRRAAAAHGAAAPVPPAGPRGRLARLVRRLPSGRAGRHGPAHLTGFGGGPAAACRLTPPGNSMLREPTKPSMRPGPARPTTCSPPRQRGALCVHTDPRAPQLTTETATRPALSPLIPSRDGACSATE